MLPCQEGQRMLNLLSEFILKKKLKTGHRNGNSELVSFISTTLVQTTAGWSTCTAKEKPYSYSVQTPRYLINFALMIFFSKVNMQVQWNLDLRNPDLRKNLNLRKIVGTSNFLVHKLFDLRKIF